MGVLLLASECAYLALLRLNATNGLRPVLNFLALLGALFALYAFAFFLVRGVRETSRAMLLMIAVGAFLFRLTLLPAGSSVNRKRKAPTAIISNIARDVSRTPRTRKNAKA